MRTGEIAWPKWRKKRSRQMLSSVAGDSFTNIVSKNDLQKSILKCQLGANNHN